MIKFCGVDRDTARPALGVGLTRQECDRMLAGEPIAFNTLGMADMPEMEVLIFAGESEQEMGLELLEGGAVTRDQIHADPSLADPHIHPVDKKGVD